MAQNINPRADATAVPETPYNTPQVVSALQRDTLPAPAVATIGEDEEEDAPEANPASLLAQNPALLNMVHGKLNTLVGRPSGYIESLPAPVKRRIEGLKGIQQEHVKIEKEFQLEMLELEKKFAAKYAPLYSRRAEIVSGKVEPTDEEVAAGEAADSDSEDEEESGAKVTEVDDAGNDKFPEDVKGIPEFWSTALKNHAIIGEQISERDEEALKHLVDIKLEYLDTKQAGFKLLFYFSPNEFFDDEVLEKTYYYQEEIGYGGDFVYDKAVGHQIAWKEDKDLTKTIEMKKQRNKNTNRTRVVKKVIPTDSFFNFFSPPQPPSIEDMENGDVDEEELELLDEKLEVDYQIGEDLKERIIPRAIDYFTGKALEYEQEDDEFEDEDEFDEDDDEDDDDEDDSRRKAPPAGQDPAECKQQ